MKMKMPPKIYRLIAKHWPLICGLIIGGMLGGIMQSVSAFLLFGMIGWAYFYFDFFHAVNGTPYSPSSHEEWLDDLREDWNRRRDDDLSMGAAGVEPYATMYGYSNDD